ncbi:MAG: hypothetical protein CL678_14860 [Bdellovibrionaceae bacterium]|nr:hypothetical protein [Pseudobdellovibrionaceae bacterium]|tara:strand:- start:7705 stop:8721 length:1017 start_codon:yes stop_codon:yes gene_type:complete
MNKKWALFFVGVFLFFGMNHAFSAQSAKVSIEGANVYKSPSEGGEVIESLDQGQKVPVSNYPTRGFYKVRTPSGQIGWIKGEEIKIFSRGKRKRRRRNLPPTENSNPYAAPMTRNQRRQKNESESYKKFRVKALGGLSLYSPTELNTQIGAEAFSSSIHFGGEFSYAFSPRFSVLGRVEYLTKSLTATISYTSGTSETNEYALSYTSLPLMLGAAYQFPVMPKMWIRLIGAGGLALLTDFTATLQSSTGSTSSSLGNDTTISTSGFTGLAAVEANYFILPAVAAFLEVGFRFLSTSETAPSVAGNGSRILNNSDNSGFVSLPLSMTGFVVSGGVSYSF